MVEVAALGAAVLIALQLGISHWFYLYIPWFFPLVLIALARRAPGRGGSPPRRGTGMRLAQIRRRRLQHLLDRLCPHRLRCRRDQAPR